MKASVSKSDLVSALKLVSKAKEKNTYIPVLDEYLISVSENKITVTAGSLDNFIEVDIPSSNQDEFKFLIGENQMKLIDKLGDMIHFEYNQSKLTISSGKDISNSNPMSAEEYPKVDTIDNSNSFTIKDTKAFVERFSKAKRFTGNDDLRPAMCGINLAFNYGVLEIAATDAHKLYTASFEVKNIDNEGGFVCRSIVAWILSSIKPISLISISIGSKYALFDINGNIRIKTKIINERYPNYQSVIPQNPQSSRMDKKQLLVNVEKALLFTNKTTNLVAFTFFENTAEIYSEELDYEHEFKTEISSENLNFNERFKIGFNGKYLTSLVKEIDSDTVTILTSDPHRACTFKSSNELYLLMPVKLY